MVEEAAEEEENQALHILLSCHNTIIQAFLKMLRVSFTLRNTLTGEAEEQTRGGNEEMIEAEATTESYLFPRAPITRARISARLEELCMEDYCTPAKFMHKIEKKKVACR